MASSTRKKIKATETGTTTEFRETATLLLGTRGSKFVVGSMVYQFQGTSHSVEVSWEEVIRTDEANGSVVGFYHTHPKGSPRISYRDQETMEQWVACLGKPLICAIECDGKLRVWNFPRKGWPVECRVNEKVNGHMIFARI